jgi:hypothetical protein
MGFPDSFKIPVSDTQAYQQFGNSVVVPVVRAIAEKIVEALMGQDRSSGNQCLSGISRTSNVPEKEAVSLGTKELSGLSVAR